MYNKKYRFDKIEEFNHYNPIYEGMEGRICYPAYLNPGERGWILYENEVNDWMPVIVPHRLHTSVIKNVEYIVGDELGIVITTENTRFTLKSIEGTDE